jgi:hypothetical protein
MKYIISSLLFFLITINLSHTFSEYAFPEQNNPESFKLTPPVTQYSFDANNIATWFISSGIFNQDLRVSNHPGFMWPKGSGKYAIFTTGLTIAALVNNNLRMAAASYTGEFTPGYIVDSSGIPVARTNSSFKIYKVTAWSNNNEPDYVNWYLMVPYGAPYKDVNNNHTFDPGIDIPGMPNSAMTIFICLTDGFQSTHTSGEGFGGGTLPLFAEIHLTAWSYLDPGREDFNYVRWEVINKSHSAWTSTYMSVICDPDLGYSGDDYIGCDTAKRLGFCYNGDNNDDEGLSPYAYGLNPPAVGFDLLQSAVNRSVNPPRTLGMTSFTYFTNSSSSGPACEKDPHSSAEAYNFMKGLKKDGSSWVIPPGGSSNVTKYCYTGDPEAGLGWNEGMPGDRTGSIQNCGGLTGNYVQVNPPGDRRFIISSGANNFTVSPGETQTLAIGQLIARGSSNLRSVTLLKQLDNLVKNVFVIGVQQISNNVPAGYLLYQNYPNPFNPSTTIKFEIPAGVKSENLKVKIIIYDVLGEQVEVLLNESLTPGTYEVNWDASNHPSGLYLYSLSTEDFVQTRKMVLIK